MSVRKRTDRHGNVRIYKIANNSKSCRSPRLRRCNGCGFEQVRASNSHMIRIDGKRIFCGTMRLVRE